MGIFLQVDYTNYAGDAFKITIEDDTYSGDITQVQGRAILERPKVKTMDILRGSVLKMELEADTSSTYYNRLIDTVGDKKLPVKFYKNGTIFWNGFVKPDGIVESFVHDYWIIQVQAIDGLGLLENIKFLNSDDEQYQGSVSELELLARCIELTGQSMDFRVYDMNLYYTVDSNAPVLANEALITTYVNTDRYVNKDQEETVFTAKDVLEAILKKYGAFITQQDNLWHIVRVVDYYSGNATKNYKQYNLSAVLQSDSSEFMTEILGSDIDGYDPCHAQGNQQKRYKSALGAYKVFYEYGFAISILENYKVYFNDTAGDIDGWTVEDNTFFTTGNFVSAVPGWPSGYYERKLISLERTIPLNTTIDALTSDSSPIASVESGDFVSFEVKGTFTQRNYYLTMFVEVKLVGDSGTEYFLNGNGEWTLSDAYIKILNSRISVDEPLFDNGFSSSTKSNSVDEDGEIIVTFMRPTWSDTTTRGQDTVLLTEVNLTGSENGLKGESFTARKLSDASAVVEDTETVYVGDNIGEIYIGGIEDSSGDNTLRWSKAPGGVIDSSKQFKVLDWLTRDRMQISGGNATQFKGGILGYQPYFCDLTINNVTGVFMTTAWRYDTVSNQIEAEHERIFTDDIYSSVTVEFKLEADNVVKPAIE